MKKQKEVFLERHSTVSKLKSLKRTGTGDFLISSQNADIRVKIKEIVDRVVFITAIEGSLPSQGEMAAIEITDALPYDLIGKAKL